MTKARGPQNDQVTPAETEVILGLAQCCLALPGDFVELGCYRGDTSVLLGKMLREVTLATGANGSALAVAKSATSSMSSPALGGPSPADSASASPAPAKRLWIYDSFAGLPAKTAEDASGVGRNFQAGELLVSKREVIDKLRRAGLHNVIVKKAWFDDLTTADLPQEIAFAFCDGDLYASIRTSLRLVLPRLTKKGIIVVHDYNNPELPGSSRAVDEFLREHRDFCLKIRHTLAILQRQC